MNKIKEVYDYTSSINRYRKEIDEFIGILNENKSEKTFGSIERKIEESKEKLLSDWNNIRQIELESSYEKLCNYRNRCCRNDCC